MNVETVFSHLPMLETERLKLRKITLDDISEIYSYASDEEVSKFLTWETHRSVTDTKAFVEYAINQYKNKQLAPWGIECKENREFIGTIDFISWKVNHRVAEIGYVISKEYWGKGITTEAVKEVVKFGFKQMDLVRIQAQCFTENQASARVLEKAGLVCEGILRKAMYIKGNHRDIKMYSILREDFFNDLSYNT